MNPRKSSTRRRIAFLGLAIMFLIAGSTPALARKPGGNVGPAYLVTALGGFARDGVPQGEPVGLNEPDDNSIFLVVGRSFRDPFPTRAAAVWEVTAGGVIHSLSEPTAPLNIQTSDAVDVNEAGVIVGNIQYPVGSNPRIVSYADVPGVGLAVLPMSAFTTVRAVNNVGEIVGTDASDFEHGRLWTLAADGTISDPVDLGDFRPRDINDWGVMAGYLNDKAAVAWFADGDLQMVEIPGLKPGGLGSANAINNFGEVVGYSVELSSVGRRFHPFRWTSTTGTLALGTLGGKNGTAFDINDQGQIVGWSELKNSSQRAYIWQNGKMTDLNSLLGTGTQQTLQLANGINDAGHIIGSGGGHGFLLTPKP